VRPGPVVTMYELEPASGIKASRVIALADDIARNMSALSARVATIPGRSVIGIELPNPKRETVSLSELVGSQVFEDKRVPDWSSPPFPSYELHVWVWKHNPNGMYATTNPLVSCEAAPH